MRNRTTWDANMSKRKQAFLEAGFALFSANSIDSIRLEDVAEKSGQSLTTLYRYFGSKPHFLVEVAGWKWDAFFQENRRRRPGDGFEGKTAADMLDFYLGSFLELYRSHRALLRFNQFFNVYIQSGAVGPETVELYRGLMQPVSEFFHQCYERGKRDGTLRTDVSETAMLSATIHLMLAAVTRYAVGLVYEPKEGFDADAELEMLKQLLYAEYTTG